MSRKTYLPVENPTDQHTHVGLSVGYVKGRGLVATLDLVKMEQRDGFQIVTFALFATPTARIVLEDWKRDNKMNAMRAFNATLEDINKQSGVVYEAAVNLAKDVGGLKQP